MDLEERGAEEKVEGGGPPVLVGLTFLGERAENDENYFF